MAEPDLKPDETVESKKVVDETVDPKKVADETIEPKAVAVENIEPNAAVENIEPKSVATLDPKPKKNPSRFCSFRWWTDFIFPTAAKLTAAQIASADSRDATEFARLEALNNPDSIKRLREAIAINKKLLDAETERRQSVETRLSGILALTSVAAMIVIAVITFLTKSEPRASAFTTGSVIGIAFLGTYIAAQFLFALGAAIKGLERVGVDQHSLVTLLRDSGTSEHNHLCEVAKGYVNTRRQMADLINSKVTRMAIAQCALRNAVRAMVLIAIALFAMTVQQSLVKKSGSDSESQQLDAGTHLK